MKNKGYAKFGGGGAVEGSNKVYSGVMQMANGKVIWLAYHLKSLQKCGPLTRYPYGTVL